MGAFDLTHSVPLIADILGAEVGVRVDSGQLDAVGLGDLQDLTVDAHGGHALLVGLRQSGLELVVSSDQTLCGRSKEVEIGKIITQTMEDAVFELSVFPYTGFV